MTDSRVTHIEKLRAFIFNSPCSIRHMETTYDDLLAGGHERWETREKVRGEVEQILDRWENPETDDHGYG